MIISRAKKARSQNGFTLVEVVIAVVVLIFVFAAVLRVATYLYSSSAAYTETSETGDAAGQFDSLMSGDFEKAGWNMAQEPLANLSGENAVGILPHDDYKTVGNGSFMRVEQTSLEPAVLGYIVKSSAPAQVSFTPEGVMYLGWRSTANPSQNRFISVQPDNRAAVVYEDGVQQDTSEFGAYYYQSGDSLQIRLDSVVIGQTPVCAVSYYYERNQQPHLFYRSSNPCPSFSVEVFFDVAMQTRVSNVVLNAPLLNPHPRHLVDTRIAPLPQYGKGKTPELPAFWDDNNRFVFFQGDSNFDRIYTQTPATFESKDYISLTVDPITRGSLAEGDYLLLIDYDANRSMVLRVANYNDDTDEVNNTSASIKAAPVFTPDAAAWGMLWSDNPLDGTSVFAAHSSVIKLAAPVQWKYDRETKSLFRRDGNAWSVAAVGVEDFSITPVRDRNQIGYEMSVTLKNDGRETDSSADGLTVKKTYYPRFLNRTANANY